MKFCKHCSTHKNENEFPDRKYKNGKIAKEHNCYDCKRKINRERLRKKRASQENRLIERQKDLKRRLANPEKEMWIRAKKRAKQKGILFDLKIEDIQMNNYCPILNIPIKVQIGGATDNSPSLDRINSSKGYTKENVCVISRLANIMKAHATEEQLTMFADNIKLYIT